MYLGRIVEVGSVTDVLLNPQHPYTKALIAAVPGGLGDPALAALPGEPPDPTRIPRGCRFHPRCPMRHALDPDDVRRDRCLDEVPVLAPGESEHLHACHLVRDAARTPSPGDHDRLGQREGSSS
jgi:peptide/nickel transport system ATP-binding protein